MERRKSGFIAIFHLLQARARGNPRRTVLLCFAALFLITFVLACRQYWLVEARELDHRRYNLHLQAIMMETALATDRKQMQFLRSTAERTLLAARDSPSQPLPDLTTNAVVGIDMLPGDAPVRILGDARLQAIAGLTRSPGQLAEDLRLARQMSRMLAVLYQGGNQLDHLVYVASSGVLVAYPPLDDRLVEPLLRQFAASSLYRTPQTPSGEFDVRFSTAPGHFIDKGPRLLLGTPLLVNGLPRGAVILDAPQQRVQEYLHRTTPEGEHHVLLDDSGTLIASSERNFDVRQDLTALFGEAADADTDLRGAGMVDYGRGPVLYRELEGTRALLLAHIPSAGLRWAVISQFSTLFVCLWLSLGVLLVITLLIVDRLLLGQLAVNERLRDLGLVDPLTRLANRRRLQTDFDGLARRLKRQQPMVLLMLDIDRFKLINDNWGHSTGDEVLKHLATLCSALVRPQDLMARYGGEEFCVLMPGIAIEQASVMAETLRAAVAQSVCLPNPQTMLSTAPSPEVRLTISIGVAELLQDDCHSLEELVARADRRLYAAKQNGRNQVVADDALVAMRQT
ncbi:diguanylate cyclase [Pseudomonas bharatica]|uniref:diguanylate cyclase n=1 Tax=Pseudomonas bharatica TaxID=2692112 RepID=UPI003B27D10C